MSQETVTDRPAEQHEAEDEMTPAQLAHHLASAAFDDLASHAGVVAPSDPTEELEPEPAPDDEPSLIELSQRVLVERGRLFSAAIIQLCDPTSPLGAPVECLATLEKLIANVLGNRNEPRVRQVRPCPLPHSFACGGASVASAPTPV